MTIICAYNDVETNCVWLGCNDRCTLDNLVPPGEDDKWINVGEWQVGVCGDGPRTEVLFSIAENTEQIPETEFELTKSLRSAFDDFDIGKDDDGVRRFCGPGMIVHRDGRIWDHDGAFALSPIPERTFWARGSGMEFALGAAAALQGQGIAGAELVHRTVSIVVELDMDCPGAPLIRRLERDGSSSIFSSRTGGSGA